MRFTILANKNIMKNNTPKAGTQSALGFLKNSTALNILRGIAVGLFWFGAWHALAVIIDKEIILPKPTSVVVKLSELIRGAEFWISCGTTVLRICAGTVLGCLAGIILAFVMLLSKTAKALFSPFISAVKAAPVASFIIAALFWLNRGHVPAFISFLIVLPVICDSVYSGIKNTDKNLIEVSKIYRFSLSKKIFYLYIPSAVPYFLTAVKTSVGMAWKSGVAAEVLCTPSESIGKELYLTKVYMETADMFAWTLTIVLFSIIFEKITVRLVEKGLKKYCTTEDEYDAEN